MPHKPISDAERAELRRLFRSVHGGGRWEAKHVGESAQHHLYAIDREGSRWLLAMPNGGDLTDLMAAMHDAVPRLFAELDALRARETLALLSRPIPILGTIS